jgi:heme/copper-type cytochrome/quinol oxidase subunit 1
LLTGAIDIQMHDTYFVIGGIQWIWNIFILIATFTYLIKEAKIVYSQILPNVILSVLLVAFLFFIFGWHIHIHFLQTFGGGWTIYPPLDALPGPVEQAPDPSVGFWHIILLALEFMIVVGLFLLGYKTGRLKESKIAG